MSKCAAFLVLLICVPSAYADSSAKQLTSLSGDLDGDGALDRAEVQQGQRSIALTVYIGTRPPQRLEFPIGSAGSDTICSLPVKLQSSDLRCSTEPGQVLLPGCTEMPGKVGLSISDEKCDAIHLYSNEKTEKIEWWRR